MDESQCITAPDVELAWASFAKNRANIVAKNAVTGQGVRPVARVPEQAARNTGTFDIEVKQGDRTDQMRSGRCWMFAALNTLRMRVMEKYKLKTFEFSQAFPLYWDKAEKANWFLENILDTLDEPVGSRTLDFLLLDPVGDGGAWDMFCALVKKYGAVPKEAMPETACSKNTDDMDMFLTRYLRACAWRLRTQHEQGTGVELLRVQKKTLMANVLHFLTICLGQPPQTFDVRLRDKDDNLVLAGHFTPQTFYREACGVNLDDFACIVSAPTADKPFDRTYTVQRLGNVVEAGGVRYLNLQPEQLKQLAVKQLQDGVPVWFGCDVDQSFVRTDGIMDLDALDVDSLFGFDIVKGFDKAARLDYGESLMTHAMVLEGVNLDEAGHPTLWKVENSWGKDHGKDGFDSLTDSWFTEYVYQVVIDKKYLTAERRRAYETMEPIELAPWDPLGALAHEGMGDDPKKQRDREAAGPKRQVRESGTAGTGTGIGVPVCCRPLPVPGLSALFPMPLTVKRPGCPAKCGNRAFFVGDVRPGYRKVARKAGSCSNGRPKPKKRMRLWSATKSMSARVRRPPVRITGVSTRAARSRAASK